MRGDCSHVTVRLISCSGKDKDSEARDKEFMHLIVFILPFKASMALSTQRTYYELTGQFFYSTRLILLNNDEPIHKGDRLQAAITSIIP
jgi:hypothetical protein